MIKVYRESDFFDEEESIYAFFTRGDSMRNMHAHDFWEIAYAYEGEGENETVCGSSKLKTGDFLLIKPGAEHSITSGVGENSAAAKESAVKKNGATARICNCLIRRAYFEKLVARFQKMAGLSSYLLYDMLSDNKPFCIQLTDDNAGNVRHLIWQIAHEYNHFTVGSDEIMENALTNMLIYMTRLYEYREGSVTTPVSRHGEIDELIKYMSSNFGQNLTLEFLAGQVHLSREYLSRYFKRQTGKTISEFLAEIRISKAKEMLRTDTFPIGFISEYCGYRSTSAFEKAFKKATGMSPSSYRISVRSI